MMFWMNVFATVITTAALFIPFPYFISSSDMTNEFSAAIDFVRLHPQILKDILLFSLAGATGQLFIFETLEHFGSLTLVTITVTRKLFTMLLSVVVFGHNLVIGQWLGVGCVFSAIALESFVKRQSINRFVHEKEKAEIKIL